MRDLRGVDGAGVIKLPLVPVLVLKPGEEIAIEWDCDETSAVVARVYRVAA